ncbi:MAG: hypothetical protein H6834_05775 [Planctomycetes bacterium]|nr:hypothetical protein [Planctomycetota bacterium]MCB9890902.1 hypothetical protein [Planctomycetota bacterium]
MRTAALVLVALGWLSHPLTAQGVILGNGTPDPSYVGLWSWYDAANGVNGSATALPHGTQITSWDDRSQNARHLTRVDATATRNPTASDDMLSCGPAVGFDGDDYIWASTGDIGTLTNPRTIFVVVKADQADRGYVFDSSTIAGRTALFTGQTSNPDVWNVYWSDNALGVSELMVGPSIDTGRYLLHTILIDAGRQEYWINGQMVASDTKPQVGSMGGFLLGNRYNLILGLTGYIREVLIYEEALSSLDQQLIEAYLLNRHPYGSGVPYGNACQGSGGFAPTLATRGCPMLGGTFELEVRDGLGTTPLVYLFGFGRVTVPIGPCEWSIGSLAFILDGFVTSGTGPGAGTHRLSLTLPGVGGPGRGTVQAVLLDPGAAPLSVTSTNGLELTWF